MSADLYGVLGLTKSCSNQDVKNAFRRVALRLHPDRARLAGLPEQHEHRHVEQRRFALAARAFEVLSDRELRDGYDLEGDAALPVFHGDPCRTFRDLFGTDNPFLANLRSSRVQPCEPGFDKPSPPEELLVPLRLTLREISKGVEKVSRVSVRVGAQEALERTFVVDVAPGAETGSRYAFHRQGHRDSGSGRPPGPPGDVVFVLEELPHPTLHREAADLVRTVSVSLREALTGCTVATETLDGRVIRVAVTDIVKPGYERRVAHEGLPLPRSALRDAVDPLDAQDPDDLPRGDLVLRFTVEFPAALPRAARVLLDQALQVAEGGDLRLSRTPRIPAQGPVTRAILEEKMRRQALAK